MSEFLLEKSRRNNMQVSQSQQKLWKEWHFISEYDTACWSDMHGCCHH